MVVCGSECRVGVIVGSCDVPVYRYAYEHIDEWTRVQVNKFKVK